MELCSWDCDPQASRGKEDKVQSHVICSRVGWTVEIAIRKIGEVDLQDNLVSGGSKVVGWQARKLGKCLRCKLQLEEMGKSVFFPPAW